LSHKKPKIKTYYTARESDVRNFQLKSSDTEV
jgi:hypothetical protein